MSATAYVFAGSNCQVFTYTLNRLFISQTSLNGTGLSASVPNGFLHTFGKGPSPTLWSVCKNSIPQGGNLETGSGNGNIFVLVPKVAGSCSRTLVNNATLATNPFPTALGTWQCDDPVMLFDPRNAADSVKLVEDGCPACSGGFGGDQQSDPNTVAHIDTYTSSPGCRAHDPSIADYVNFYGIRIR